MFKTLIDHVETNFYVVIQEQESHAIMDVYHMHGIRMYGNKRLVITINNNTFMTRFCNSNEEILKEIFECTKDDETAILNHHNDDYGELLCELFTNKFVSKFHDLVRRVLIRYEP